MKRFLLLLLLAIPFICGEVCAQKKVKLRIDEIDKFENKRTFATDWIKVHSSMKTPATVYFSIVHYGQTSVLAVKMITGEVDLVRKGAPAKFIMSDGKIKTLSCTGETWSGRGDGAIGLSGSNALGLNIQYIGDLSFLSGDITDVRIEGKEYNYDAEIKPKAQKLIKSMYNAYLEALNK